MNCDLTSALEDGSIGGIIIAIVWFLVHWFGRNKQPKPSR